MSPSTGFTSLGFLSKEYFVLLGAEYLVHPIDSLEDTPLKGIPSPSPGLVAPRPFEQFVKTPTTARHQDWSMVGIF